MDIKLIIGLGNPGKEYKNTYHNAGFLFIDALRNRLEYQFSEINKKEYELTFYPTLKLKLLKPLTFMNNSGTVVGNYLRNAPVEAENILIVHDDLDLSLGKYKLQFGKFPKVHNGINSIQKVMGETNFHYLRIGIETRDQLGKARISGEKQVLMKFDKEQAEILNKTIDSAVEELAKEMGELHLYTADQDTV